MLLLKTLRSFLSFLKYRKIKFGHIGKNCSYKALSNQYASPQNIFLSDNVQLSTGCKIDAMGSVFIGIGTIFGPDVTIFSRTHNFDETSALPFDNVMLTAPVHIGRYVWIGTKAIILPGVTIGDGAVIGAGAVIAKDIPSCAVAVGNPARVIRYRNLDTFQTVLKSKTPFVYDKHGHSKITQDRIKR